MKTLSPDIISTITKRLVNEFKPDKIILFGSYAWGTPDSSSDVDILVIIKESKLTPVQRSVQAHRCLRGLNMAKDIIVKTQNEFEKFSNVYASLEVRALRLGKILYDRG